MHVIAVICLPLPLKLTPSFSHFLSSFSRSDIYLQPSFSLCPTLQHTKYTHIVLYLFPGFSLPSVLRRSALQHSSNAPPSHLLLLLAADGFSHQNGRSTGTLLCENISLEHLQDSLGEGSHSAPVQLLHGFTVHMLTTVTKCWVPDSGLFVSVSIYPKTKAPPKNRTRAQIPTHSSDIPKTPLRAEMDTSEVKAFQALSEQNNNKSNQVRICDA